MLSKVKAQSLFIQMKL